MKTVENFYYQASGLVLTDFFTHEQLQDDDFDICDHAWEPLEYWDAKELHSYIAQIASNLFQAHELGLKGEE